jgi:hypothetical protein
VGIYGLHISFQINAGIRRQDEYSTVWKAASVFISNEFRFPLCLHGKTYVSASYGNSLLYSTGSVCVNLIIFLKKQNRNIDINITYHYNRDAIASLSGKPRICNKI